MSSLEIYFKIKDGGLTTLEVARLGSQVGKVNVSFPPINDGVGVFAGSVGGPPVRHGYL